MADLSTLNVANPSDGEAVSVGASRIRDVALSTVTSFGLEHNLGGTHKRITDGYNNYLAGVVGVATTFQDVVAVTVPVPTNAKLLLWATVKILALIQGTLRCEFRVGATVLTVPATDTVIATVAGGTVTTVTVQAFAATPPSGSQPCAFRLRAADGTITVAERVLTVLAV